MDRAYPREFIFQAASLIVAAILVHALYMFVVRPQANAVLSAEAALMQADPGHVQERSVWIIIRDFEQESCFVLMLWAFAIMGYKSARSTQRLQGRRPGGDRARSHLRRYRDRSRRSSRPC